MRVLHVSQPTSEGVAVVVCRLVVAQVERGWSVIVACPPNGWLANRAQELGAMVLAWPSVRHPLHGVASEVRSLNRLLRDIRPDLVHLHSAKAGLSGRLAIRGRLVTIYQPHAWSFHAAGATRRFAREWERRAARWTDLVLAVSTDERDEGIASGVLARYQIAANGVVARDWGKLTRSAARNSLNLGTGPKAVCVGRLARQKGQDRILEIWPAVRRSVANAELYLVGDGPLRPELQRAAPTGVQFAGSSDEVDTWLCAADIVILPSRWEAGGSLALFEAMAAQRSVVATRVAGIDEALHPGFGAILSQGDQAGLLAEVIHRLTSPAEADMEGRAARRWIETNLDASSLARHASDAYLTIARIADRSS